MQELRVRLTFVITCIVPENNHEYHNLTGYALIAFFRIPDRFNLALFWSLVKTTQLMYILIKLPANSRLITSAKLMGIVKIHKSYRE